MQFHVRNTGAPPSQPPLFVSDNFDAAADWSSDCINREALSDHAHEIFDSIGNVYSIDENLDPTFTPAQCVVEAVVAKGFRAPQFDRSGHLLHASGEPSLLDVYCVALLCRLIQAKDLPGSVA